MLAYYYTNNEKDYFIMNIEVNSVKKATVNDKLEYYYYLSDKSKETDIKDWVKITETQSSNNKLEFTINTKKISNYDTVSKVGTLYLYVKEVATRDGKTYITNSMKLGAAERKVEYVNDMEKKENNGGGSSTTTGKNDNTTATGKYPYTGKTILFISIIVIVAITGAVGFIKYKTIDK